MRLRKRRVRRAAMPTWRSPSARVGSWRRFESICPRPRRRGDRMRRREFIVAIGSAAAWPLAARAQQPKMPVPVIGYLNGASAAQFGHLLAAFRDGLREQGYAEGRNVAIEYRYADGQYDPRPGPSP